MSDKPRIDLGTATPTETPTREIISPCRWADEWVRATNNAIGGLGPIPTELPTFGPVDMVVDFGTNAQAKRSEVRVVITAVPRMDLTDLPGRRARFRPLVADPPNLFVDVVVETTEKRYERRGAYAGAVWLGECGVHVGFPEEFLADYAPPVDWGAEGPYRVSATILEAGFTTRGRLSHIMTTVATLRDPG